MNRYLAGIKTYLGVITAQSATLANERAAVDVLTRRMSASVNLIKTLGGGWRAADLPYDGAATGSPAPAAPGRADANSRP